jgi:polysaccharide export outer membrane protein
MVAKSASVLLAVTSLACIFCGCAGGGNRLISNRGGEVERAELVLDSIPQRPEPEEYIIGQGDVVDVLFFYSKDLNQLQLKVRPDGKITLPYLGDVTAAGKPVSALDSLLTVQYSEILIQPEVAVVVREYAQQVVYVLGEVGRPGGYPFANGMTLLDFLAVSGGPIRSSKRSGVVVIRRVAPDHIVGIQVDLRDILDEKRFDLDVSLRPYDILYVPKAELSKVQDFVAAVGDILGMPADLYIRGWYIANVKTIYDFYKKQGQAQNIQ